MFSDCKPLNDSCVGNAVFCQITMTTCYCYYMQTSAGPVPISGTSLASLVSVGAGTNTDSCPNVSVIALTHWQDYLKHGLRLWWKRDVKLQHTQLGVWSLKNEWATWNIESRQFVIVAQGHAKLCRWSGRGWRASIEVNNLHLPRPRWCDEAGDGVIGDASRQTTAPCSVVTVKFLMLSISVQ